MIMSRQIKMLHALLPFPSLVQELESVLQQPQWVEVNQTNDRLTEKDTFTGNREKWSNHRAPNDSSSNNRSVRTIHSTRPNEQQPTWDATMHTYLSRTWKRRPFSEWCHSSNQGWNETTTAAGIIFIKVPKSASSTITGTLLRLARTPPPPTDNYTTIITSTARPETAMQCSVQWEHGTARERLTRPQLLRYTQQELRRQHEESPKTHSSSPFIVTTLRWPADRALSSVYFHRVSFHAPTRRERDDGNNSSNKVVPRDELVLRELRQTPSNYILDYTTPIPTTSLTKTADTTTAIIDTRTADVSSGTSSAVGNQWLQRNVQAILHTYDFIIVTERLAESMVVLAWLVQVPLSRFLTLSAKRSGSWYFVKSTAAEKQRRGAGRCIPLQAPVKTPAVHAYLESKEWYQAQEGDILLYAAANSSLQRTIDFIGRDKVQRALQQWQLWQDRITATCRNAITAYCSDTGQPQWEKARDACYERDFGCGYACIDRVAAEHSKNGRTKIAALRHRDDGDNDDDDRWWTL